MIATHLVLFSFFNGASGAATVDVVASTALIGSFDYQDSLAGAFDYRDSLKGRFDYTTDLLGRVP